MTFVIMPDDPELGSIAGPVLRPDAPEAAAETSGYNTAIVNHPALTVGATSAEDVAAAVTWAARRRLPVAVLATGHGAVLPADGAVLVNTRRMNEIAVDPLARTVRVGPGARNGQVLQAVAPHGLGLLIGSCAGVGTVGFVTGGGLSILGRTFGYAADHVRSFEIVTADGRLRHVDRDHEPDLFWAVRGGQGNFGVVTSMLLDLVPITTLYGGTLYFSAEAMPTALHAYREWAATLPDETTTIAALVRLPPRPSLPPALAGKPALSVFVAHVGDASTGAELVAPIRRAAPPVVDTVGELPWAQAGELTPDSPQAMPVWDRGVVLAELPAAAIDRLLDIAGPGAEMPIASIQLRQLGGAMRRQPPAPNAIGGREGAFGVLATGFATPEVAEQLPGAGARVFDALRPWSTRGMVLNLSGTATSTPEAVAQAWSEAAYERLRAIKREVDPTNLFQIGHTIPPAS